MTRGEIDALIAEIIISQEKLTFESFANNPNWQTFADLKNALLFA